MLSVRTYHFTNLAKQNSRKQRSLLTRQWVWPSGSLMAPVLCFFFLQRFIAWLILKPSANIIMESIMIYYFISDHPRPLNSPQYRLPYMSYKKYVLKNGFLLLFIFVRAFSYHSFQRALLPATFYNDGLSLLYTYILRL